MTVLLDSTDVVPRLYRRIGLGLRGGELDTIAERSPSDAVSALLDTSIGDDPWAGTDYTVLPGPAGGQRRRLGLLAISAWIDALVDSEQPVDDWLAWFWHGRFVSALTEVKNPQFMVDQIRVLRARGRGSFGELIRAVTIDAAMLLYLDGNDSTAQAPNENYSRELLELFTIGHGAYTEDDVAAGAAALSGWRIDRSTGDPQLRTRRHDSTPRRYLQADGVHDVNTVVTAIEHNPELAITIAARLAAEIVGPQLDPAVIVRAAAAFTAANLNVDVLLRSLVDEVLAGADGGQVVSGPLLWYVAARRATGAKPEMRDVFPQLRAAGQVPWLAPNVSGWPSGAAWNNAATLVARFALAELIADSTPADSVALTAGDRDQLARALGITTAWSDTTAAALDRLDRPRERLVLALVSPEFVNC